MGIWKVLGSLIDAGWVRVLLDADWVHVRLDAGSHSLGCRADLEAAEPDEGSHDPEEGLSYEGLSYEASERRA